MAPAPSHRPADPHQTNTEDTTGADDVLHWLRRFHWATGEIFPHAHQPPPERPAVGAGRHGGGL